MSYVDQVLKASGGHGAPAENLDMDEDTLGYDPAELDDEDSKLALYLESIDDDSDLEFSLPDNPIVAALEPGEPCPPATQDIELNLENRQNAIDNVGYGPLNPAEPNDSFWQDKAERWNTTTREAKTALCGNCIFFIRTPKMLDCIEEGIGLGSQEAEGSIEAGELGYCNALDFKCASERTCNAWAAGGPVTEDSGVTATAGSKPAPKKDQIRGSKKNRKGSAATGKGVSFTKKIEKSLSEKVKKHNEKARDGRRTSLRTLKAVYRRGAGAFSTSHRPDQNRNSWAMARVNAYLHLLKSGSPKNKKYVTDNDLLPASHPRSSKKSASMVAAGDPCWDGYVQIGMKKKNGVSVPNCVPSSATINEYVSSVNENYGVTRQVEEQTAYTVAQRALEKYSYLEEFEIEDAILWEVMSFAEYATSGTAPEGFNAEEYTDLVVEGHPSKGSSLVASIEWLAGAPEFSESSRYALLSAFSDSTDYIQSLHSVSRIKAMVSSGSLSDSTIQQLKRLVELAAKDK